MSSLESDSGVQRLQVEEVVPQSRKVTRLRAVDPVTPDLFPQTAQETTLPPSPPVIIQRTGIPEAIVAVFSVLGYALSARLILTLSLIGAFTIAFIAMREATVLSLCTLVAYCALTVLPCAALELYGKRPPE